MSTYELVSHTADISIRLRAPEAEGLWGLFVAGADALRGLLFEGEHLETVSDINIAVSAPLPQKTGEDVPKGAAEQFNYPPYQTEHLSIAASDPELLLFDWLSTLLLHSTTYYRAYLSFEAELFSPTRLSTLATYVERRPWREIKGITMHNLHITFDGSEWHAEVTVDL